MISKKVCLLLLTLICVSCSQKKQEQNFVLKGNINGLKKGTIYLQRVNDTALVTIDSMEVKGNAEFSFISQIEEPEIHYIYLDKEDGKQYNDRVDFFAEPGEISITTNVMDFERDIKITGGKNQTKYAEYKKMLKRFNDRNLRLIKENYEASKQKDNKKLAENDKAYKNLLQQKYLYTVNFALYNKKLEVAPYVTLNEIYDANIKLLDTVARSLSPEVKKSVYGKQLVEYVKDLKNKKTQGKEEKTKE